MDLEKNKGVQIFYKCKIYFDIGVQQVAWLTGKIPEVAGSIWILDKLNVPMNAITILFLGSGLFFSFVGLGVFMKRSGLWIKERKVAANIDPVMGEVYRAALKVNRDERK